MRAVFVASRLTDHDGVSVELRKWAAAFGRLGFELATVAGSGPADRIVAGLGASGEGAFDDEATLEAALADADLVVVENLCSLPLHPAAADAVARCLRHRPAILHHHDLAWQRPHLAHIDRFPPDDAAWAHVTINHLSRDQLAMRGISATTIHNCFDTYAPPGNRATARAAMDMRAGQLVLLHPTRAIPRKNVPAALALAEALAATYWLLGPPEDGYGDELDRLLNDTSAPVRQGLPAGITLADAFAACDAVTLPSSWEGFGNATVESAIHRRPLAIGRYPVAAEIAAYGFRWFPADNPEPLASWLASPEPSLLDHNRQTARRLSLDELRRQLSQLINARGWAP